MHPIPRVLSRHNLLLGCEREPILLSALVFGGVTVSSMTIAAFIACGLLWVASLYAFRWMAKADPQLTKVYQRNVKYKGYYPAFSTPAADQSNLLLSIGGVSVIVLPIIGWLAYRL